MEHCGTYFFILCFVLLVCCVSCCFFSWYALVAQFARAICLAWLFTHLQLCLVVHFFILPFHMLGSLHTCCLPLSSNPTCSPEAVEFSTGGIVCLRDATGEGQPEGLLVVLYWHLLLFPWVYSKIFVFWHSHLPCSPFPAWSTLWQQVLGSSLPPHEGAVAPDSHGSSSSRWLLATSGMTVMLTTAPDSPHGSSNHRPPGSPRQSPLLCGAVWEPLAWYSGRC